jgi:hypothetical protein
MHSRRPHKKGWCGLRSEYLNIQAHGNKILTKIKLSLEKKGFVYGWPSRQTTLTIYDPNEKNTINIYYTAANGNSRSFSYVCTNKKPSDCINKESDNISNYVVAAITDLFTVKNNVYDFYQRQHLAIYVDVDLDRKSDDDKRKADRSKWSVESKLMDEGFTIYHEPDGHSYRFRLIIKEHSLEIVDMAGNNNSVIALVTDIYGYPTVDVVSGGVVPTKFDAVMPNLLDQFESKLREYEASGAPFSLTYKSTGLSNSSELMKKLEDNQISKLSSSGSPDYRETYKFKGGNLEFLSVTNNIINSYNSGCRSFDNETTKTLDGSTIYVDGSYLVDCSNK